MVSAPVLDFTRIGQFESGGFKHPVPARLGLYRLIHPQHVCQPVIAMSGLRIIGLQVSTAFVQRRFIHVQDAAEHAQHRTEQWRVGCAQFTGQGGLRGCQGFPKTLKIIAAVKISLYRAEKSQPFQLGILPLLLRHESHDVAGGGVADQHQAASGPEHALNLGCSLRPVAILDSILTRDQVKTGRR